MTPNADVTLRRTYSRGLVLDPADAMMIWRLAAIFSQSDINVSNKLFTRLVELLGDSYEGYAKIGSSFLRVGDRQRAGTWLRKAFLMAPGRQASILGMLKLSKQDEFFKQLVTRYIQLDPNAASHRLTLGNCFRSLGQMERSREYVKQAVCLVPDDALIWCDYSAILLEFSEIESAQRCLTRGLFSKPSSAQVSLNLGLQAFMRGDFRSAWALYESRWGTANFSGLPSLLGIPEWKPGMSGRVLVWAEQGLGDEVMFMSMFPDLLSIADDVTLQIDSRLIEVARRSFGRRCRYLARQDQVSADRFDSHIAIGSLGKWFRSDIQSFENSRYPYFFPSIDKRSYWSSKLDAVQKGLKIGVAWRSEHPVVGFSKSIELKALRKSFGRASVLAVDLQYHELPSGSNEFASLFGNCGFVPDVDLRSDVESVIAIASCCDLVITVSNAVAHLAGATGVPTILMLRAAGDWRWTDQDGRSLWYPSVRICRQKHSGDWSECFALVEDEINALVAEALNG